MAAEVVRAVACEIHGPLRRHGGHWGCAGFDGEGCLNSCAHVRQPLPHAAYLRVLSGITRWPGCVVLSINEPRQVAPIVIAVHGADECPRCSLPSFNWLECTCGLFCRTAVNCNGLRERRK